MDPLMLKCDASMIVSHITPRKHVPCNSYSSENTVGKRVDPEVWNAFLSCSGTLLHSAKPSTYRCLQSSGVPSHTVSTVTR